VITIVIVFIIAALLATLSGLIGDEVRGWLDLVPRAILRLVATRLPADQRQAIYNEEWLPELTFELNKAQGRPITRLVRGTWYAVSMTRAVDQVGRILADVREPEREIGSSTQDLFAGVDEDAMSVETYEHTYKHGNNPANSTGGVMITSGITFSGQGRVDVGGNVPQHTPPGAP
jgi:hypothetical protein